MNNSTCIQFFDWYCAADGGHWNRAAASISTLTLLGIDGVWLPPAYKGTEGEKSVGYDVYDLYDLGEFDQKGSTRTKYGTKQEYLDAVKKMRESGIKVYVDIVMNHMGGADETEKITVRRVDPENRNEFTSEPFEITAFTKFTFPGRGNKHSQFVWDHHCFTGVDYAHDMEENAIFSIQNEYGEGWKQLSHQEKGNFDYLILNDIETRNPAVVQELKNWIKWYYETVPFDGVRLDAVKHMDPAFITDWLEFLRTVAPGMAAMGEFWLSDDLAVLLHYAEVTKESMMLFDAPLHHNLSQASVLRDQYDLRKIFDESLVKVKPHLAVTFVDNHDTQPLQSLEEYTEQWFKPHAYALILLRSHGYPCVFYADLYGSCYEGTDKNGDPKQVELPVLECLPALLELRKQNSYGDQLDYFEHEHCIGWVRKGDAEHPGSGCAVVLNTSSSETQGITMFPGEHFAGKKFIPVIGATEEVMIDETGQGYFPAPPGTAAVWKPWSDVNKK